MNMSEIFTTADFLLRSTAHEEVQSTSVRPLFIFILGAPGVGKGTISAFLKTAVPGLTHLSYGDLTRYHDGIPGTTIETGMRNHNQCIWLLDGFPRTGEHVAEWVAQLPPADCTLYLFCPPEVSMERVAGRAATSGRLDDANADRVRERVTRINAESGAMLDALEAAGMRVARVNTNRDLGTVKEEVLGIGSRPDVWI
ncbi:P-loop containing nucleoside triphosphate hydrolase protein [Hypoxylon sp. FL1150]|nr:P-loop containing nucleoside triphosphate hydrolase protein [Hypoxylon sp. FL1150]